MYIYFNNSRPYLAIANWREPNLLMLFGNHFPMEKFGEYYHLRASLGREWYNHFMDKIVIPNMSQPGGMTPMRVSQEAMSRKFNEWISSTDDIDLFGTKPLKDLRAQVGDLATAMICVDFRCMQCGNREPLSLFLGTSDDNQEWHQNYETFGKRLDKPLIYRAPETDGCFSCSPNNWYTTPRLMSFARCRPGSCQCMPCRGRL